MFGLKATDDVQLIAALIGLGGALWIYWLTNAQQRLVQRAETYMKLEMEASRIFEIARENARLVAFFNGKFVPETPEERADLEHQVAWYLPQVLNLFEISISFYKRKIFDRDIFATWVSWYLEVGSAEGFQRAWKDLRMHYKSDLRPIMEYGIKAGDMLHRGVDAEQVTRWYFEQVAHKLPDLALLTYYDNSRLKD
jgi:hypothetical protein